MKKIIFFTLIFELIVCLSCENKNEFEITSHEVYKIIEIEKGGCFDYGIDDSLTIAPIGNSGIQAYIKDGIGYIEYDAEYVCYAEDSIILSGNVMHIYIKPKGDYGNCMCNYSWVVHLDILENKGIRILYYEFENGQFTQKQEMYDHKLSNLDT
jgi:hypothetical protein